jgi:hypothetical protein
MRRILLILIIYLLVGTIYAQADDEAQFSVTESNFEDRWTIDLFTRLMISPQQSQMGVGESILWHILTLRVGVGIGYNYELINNILSPGIYVDLGISPFMFFSDSSEEDEYNSLGDIGIRINNQFRWNVLDIKPFYGISLYYNGYLFHQLGLFFGIKKLGFEYTYLSHIFREKITFHRISILWNII